MITRNDLIGFGILATVVVVALQVLGSRERTDCEYYRANTISTAMNFRIMDKYVDTAVHDLKTLVVMEGDYSFKMIRPDLFEQVEVGDSIVKAAGSSSGFVFSKLGKVRAFHFRTQCK